MYSVYEAWSVLSTVRALLKPENVTDWLLCSKCDLMLSSWSPICSRCDNIVKKEITVFHRFRNFQSRLAGSHRGNLLLQHATYNY